MKTKIISSIAFTVLLSACSSEEKNLPTSIETDEVQASVIQPIPGLEIKPEVYRVNNNESSIIKLPTGGSIEIPANAFVDKNGKNIDGMVDILWKEYHTLTDLILSGIPMKYDSAGVVYNFVSGGMFSIAGKYNDEEAFVAKGKSLDVNLASIDDTPCYNFYKIDEKSGDWDYITTQNGTKIEENQKSKKAKNDKKEAKKEDETILDVAPSNLKDFPELNTEQIVAWRAIEKIDRKDKELLKKTKVNSTLKAGNNSGEYELHSVIDKKNFSVKVKPYLLKDALKDSKQNNEKMEKDYAELLDYQQKVANGEIMRSISINGFGTYNWDVVYKMQEPLIVNASFLFPEDINPDLVSLFLVCPAMKAQIKIASYDWKNFTFDRNKGNILIGIMPDNTLVSLGYEAFNELKDYKNGQSHVFELNDTGIKIQKGSDLASALKDLAKS